MSLYSVSPYLDSISSVPLCDRETLVAIYRTMGKLVFCCFNTEEVLLDNIGVSEDNTLRLSFIYPTCHSGSPQVYHSAKDVVDAIATKLSKNTLAETAEQSLVLRAIIPNRHVSGAGTVNVFASMSDEFKNIVKFGNIFTEDVLTGRALPLGLVASSFCFLPSDWLKMLRDEKNVHVLIALAGVSANTIIIGRWVKEYVVFIAPIIWP